LRRAALLQILGWMHKDPCGQELVQAWYWLHGLNQANIQERLQITNPRVSGRAVESWINLLLHGKSLGAKISSSLELEEDAWAQNLAALHCQPFYANHLADIGPQSSRNSQYSGSTNSREDIFPVQKWCGLSAVKILGIGSTSAESKATGISKLHKNECIS
jgi:hypothetical protein